VTLSQKLLQSSANDLTQNICFARSACIGVASYGPRVLSTSNCSIFIFRSLQFTPQKPRHWLPIQ